ncbi:MAG: hypothetical protein EON96_05835 [Caulobacteraceae bacterium]|nr:MAG: hypothetical protein EON96_05835 [Caulobacteraceae bacterium]
MAGLWPLERPAGGGPRTRPHPITPSSSRTPKVASLSLQEHRHEGVHQSRGHRRSSFRHGRRGAGRRRTVGRRPAGPVGRGPHPKRPGNPLPPGHQGPGRRPAGGLLRRLASL